MAEVVDSLGNFVAIDQSRPQPPLQETAGGNRANKAPPAITPIEALAAILPIGAAVAPFLGPRGANISFALTGAANAGLNLGRFIRGRKDAQIKAAEEDDRRTARIANLVQGIPGLRPELIQNASDTTLQQLEAALAGSSQGARFRPSELPAVGPQAFSPTAGTPPPSLQQPPSQATISPPGFSLTPSQLQVPPLSTSATDPDSIQGQIRANRGDAVVGGPEGFITNRPTIPSEAEARRSLQEFSGLNPFDAAGRQDELRRLRGQTLEVRKLREQNALDAQRQGQRTVTRANELRALRGTPPPVLEATTPAAPPLVSDPNFTFESPLRQDAITEREIPVQEAVPQSFQRQPQQPVAQFSAEQIRELGVEVRQGRDNVFQVGEQFFWIQPNDDVVEVQESEARLLTRDIKKMSGIERPLQAQPVSSDGQRIGVNEPIAGVVTDSLQPVPSAVPAQQEEGGFRLLTAEEFRQLPLSGRKAYVRQLQEQETARKAGIGADLTIETEARKQAGDAVNKVITAPNTNIAQLFNALTNPASQGDSRLEQLLPQGIEALSVISADETARRRGQLGNKERLQAQRDERLLSQFIGSSGLPQKEAVSVNDFLAVASRDPRQAEILSAAVRTTPGLAVEFARHLTPEFRQQNPETASAISTAINSLVKQNQAASVGFLVREIVTDKNISIDETSFLLSDLQTRLQNDGRVDDAARVGQNLEDLKASRERAASKQSITIEGAKSPTSQTILNKLEEAIDGRNQQIDLMGQLEDTIRSANLKNIDLSGPIGAINRLQDFVARVSGSVDVSFANEDIDQSVVDRFRNMVASDEIPASRYLGFTVAYIEATTRDPGGRLSDKDVAKGEVSFAPSFGNTDSGIIASIDAARLRLARGNARDAQRLETGAIITDIPESVREQIASGLATQAKALKIDVMSENYRNDLFIDIPGIASTLMKDAGAVQAPESAIRDILFRVRRKVKEK